MAASKWAAIRPRVDGEIHDSFAYMERLRPEAIPPTLRPGILPASGHPHGLIFFGHHASTQTPRSSPPLRMLEPEDFDTPWLRLETEWVCGSFIFDISWYCERDDQTHKLRLGPHHRPIPRLVPDRPRPKGSFVANINCKLADIEYPSMRVDLDESFEGAAMICRVAPYSPDDLRPNTGIANLGQLTSLCSPIEYHETRHPLPIEKRTILLPSFLRRLCFAPSAEPPTLIVFMLRKVTQLPGASSTSNMAPLPAHLAVTALAPAVQPNLEALHHHQSDSSSPSYTSSSSSSSASPSSSSELESSAPHHRKRKKRKKRQSKLQKEPIKFVKVVIPDYRPSQTPSDFVSAAHLAITSVHSHERNEGQVRIALNKAVSTDPYAQHAFEAAYATLKARGVRTSRQTWKPLFMAWVEHISGGAEVQTLNKKLQDLEWRGTALAHHFVSDIQTLLRHDHDHHTDSSHILEAIAPFHGRTRKEPTKDPSVSTTSTASTPSAARTSTPSSPDYGTEPDSSEEASFSRDA
ncbi:hypothetical protein BDK51DRAFT_48556 [Blyttiomyces helicus]|uniref:Uncharacterized protein n=1 Tax=Blyttiomyces helicus TaxID=388810 RepID=A0A4P9W423_9FUNG|nr:hypothetical protein BDK51DRAFT_48556 [Blyttiomyces helicus]|eukprot:RKO84906.1 hypothetical protein BDK51DRAFT_48556 [Blyttiomyces helicus]